MVPVQPDVDVPREAAAPATSVRANSAAKAAAPNTPVPLQTSDGRIVSVVHIVAELAPFARTGGLGEAVKSLAEFQSASGIPTAIIMPLYRQVHAVAPNLEQVGEPFTVHLGPAQSRRNSGRLRRTGARAAGRACSSWIIPTSSTVRACTARTGMTIRTILGDTRSSRSRR
jgi:hypothetical protein